ncbi:MAG: DNA polymerase III subunit alpha [Firmicutes bacterium]|nr:DNA polymerase III subunit alpha [Bacillota bacterium]
MDFVHLHVHSEYSLLDGAARIKDLIRKAVDMDMKALAITDHGVMFGVIDFYKEALKAGIKPIIGCEVYTSARSMKDKDAEKDKYQGHLILLAENNEGYQNLMKIVSIGYIDGFYYKPRIDYDVLRQHSKGLIALSACLAGNVQRKLLNGDYEGAKEEALALNDIFGQGNFFLELQDQGMEEEFRILPLQKKMAKELGIPVVATNDVHYVNKEDAKAQDVLMCIQTGRTVDEENRMKFATDEFYLKSQSEMERLFADVPDALENTVKIAERCNVTFEFNNYNLPEFAQPKGFKTTEDYLRYLCEKGLRNRYGEDSELHRERLDYELNTIVNMGYVEYFLIVWDFINYARENGIVVGPGRGSAAGSIVAYCLNITDIDPIKYNLIFERFLNPERISMPDIDIDFCYERRQEVIDYVIRKYGKDKVSQIITFGTLKAKAVVRDVGRALNMPYGEVDAIAKKIPFDLHMTIDRALEMNPDLKKDYEENIKVKELLDMGRALEGMPRHASTHAAGVVIANKPIDEYVPLYNSDKGLATQFPMGTVEELGLLKMDFLGLRNLTVIRDAIDMIKENHDVEIDFSKMDYDDPKVYQLIASGNDYGVFQLESSGMISFMKNLKPDCFEDIVAGVALYRPGPMDSIPKYIENKKNPEKIEYIHPSLKPILGVSYGCLVYQEQVMQIVRDLGGYTYGRSDLVRRAMGKKKMDVMQEERNNFVYGKLDDSGNVEIAGCVRNGIPEEAGHQIFDDMVKFAEYAFNKSHAAAYAVLAYETAYLKTYYPEEFMAALMTSVMGDSNQIAKYIRNCNEMGIKVLPPDVNRSGKKFSVQDGQIRFGLLAIKNVGEGVIDEILRVREEKGKFKDFFSFINNVDIHQINKKAVESMIKAGAFDSLGAYRAQLMAVYEKQIESAQNTAKKNIEGQLSLFQDFSQSIQDAIGDQVLPSVAEFPPEILLSMEKEMLGLYITGHPLEQYRKAIERVSSIDTEVIAHAEDTGEVYDGMQVVLAGMITSKKTLITKTNKRMGFIQLEDFYGSVEVIVFQNKYEEAAEFFDSDEPVVVKGRISMKEDELPKIVAESIALLDKNIPERLNTIQKGQTSVKKDETQLKPIILRISKDRDEAGAFRDIKMILTDFPGNVPVVIISERSGRKFKADKSMYVDGSDALMGTLRAYEFIGEE